MRLLVALVTIALVAIKSPEAAEQTPTSRFEVAVHVPSSMSGHFDRTEVGVGGRFGWHPQAWHWLGVESEIVLYPSAFAGQVPFSKRRIEGLFGATLGPTMGRVRPFARMRAGFLNMQAAPEPFACIAIFPPPIQCELAGGRMLPVFDVGGGVELFATERTFARVDAGDRLLRYPGPVFDVNRNIRSGFFSHDFRFALGGGLRF